MFIKLVEFWKVHISKISNSTFLSLSQEKGHWSEQQEESNS